MPPARADLSCADFPLYCVPAAGALGGDESLAALEAPGTRVLYARAPGGEWQAIGRSYAAVADLVSGAVSIVP